MCLLLRLLVVHLRTHPTRHACLPAQPACPPVYPPSSCLRPRLPGLPACRFDRELVFPLPNLTARADILGIHTSKWAEAPAPELLQELASLCVGYCGADLKVGALLGYCWYCAAHWYCLGVVQRGLAPR